jgi:hypothetical protein
MLALLACLLVAAAPPADKPIKPLPSLGKEPKLDGDLKDLAPATEFKMPESAKGASAEVALKATFKKDTLYLGITVKDDKVVTEDKLDVTLFFPDSGTTAKGVVYRFGTEGLREPPDDVGATDWAQALVKAATKVDDKGFTLEIAIPARALPRFQAFKPLALSICAEYADVDAAGGEVSLATTCPTGDMVGGPTRLPDELRKNLKLTPAPDVEGIEARKGGWVGYSKLHYASWAEADAELNAQSLGELVLGEAAIEPKKVALPIPAQLILPDNRPIYTVLTGKNPHSGKDACVDGAELRMAMYVVKGLTASRVLEWPAANCKLGRAMQFELTSDGNLTIGYTNGTTAHFTWSTDHFERSELGAAP